MNEDKLSKREGWVKEMDMNFMEKFVQMASKYINTTDLFINKKNKKS